MLPPSVEETIEDIVDDHTSGASRIAGTGLKAPETPLAPRPGRTGTPGRRPSIARRPRVGEAARREESAEDPPGPRVRRDPHVQRERPVVPPARGGERNPRPGGW